MKLTYFDVRGRAEPIRLLLELTGTPYEYEGITVADWRAGPAKLRALEVTPFAHLPLLEDGALRLSQSQAIFRHLARMTERAGATEDERVRADEIAEIGADLIMHLALLFWDPEFGKKREAHRETTQKRLEGLSLHFERRSRDGRHWIQEGRATYADVAIAFALESLLPLHPGLVEQFPALDRAMRAFFAEPNVRAYVTSERRPRTWTIGMASFGGKPEETHHWQR